MWSRYFAALGYIFIAAILASARSPQATDKEIGREFAPVFVQGIGDKPEYDYIARFDFDGDWRGDNNWVNAEKAPDATAYVYYSVCETATHYFIHYAVYHPRDYKGGDKKGAFLGELLRQGAEAVKDDDPIGLLNEVALAHENDMEGCLVVVDKTTDQVVFVETLSHNKFKRYVPAGEAKGEFAGVEISEKQPQLYIEPKGHGIEAFNDSSTKSGKERKILLYQVGAKAGKPDAEQDKPVIYELLPISTTLWPRAAKAPNITYGAVQDYGTITVGAEKAIKKVKLGSLGSAFLGKVGAINAARPPWGWFDSSERDQPLGQWFFDPARTIQRHFKLGEKFSVAYTRQPFLAIGNETVRAQKSSKAHD